MRAKIDQALIQSFDALALGVPIAWQNYPPVEPDTGEIVADLTGRTWCRVTVLPARPTVATMGIEGKDQIDGIMQVDIFSPRNTGTADAHEKADTIAAAFFAGSTHSKDDVDVHVDYCGRTGSTENPDNYRTIIEIGFHSWIRR